MVYGGVVCVYCGVLCVYGVCTVCVLWCTAGVLCVVQLGVSTTIGHSIQIQRVTVEVVVTRAIFCSSFGVTVDLHDQHLTNT